jgi:Carboxypeptidase regulatory-like domain
MKHWTKLLVAIALVSLSVRRLPAQSIFAELTGIVSDPSGAAVPDATVTLTNEASGSVRDTVTDASGYYSFASVSVGNFTYKLTVTVKGFETYVAPGLALLGGEKQNVNVTLKLGSTTATVEVTGQVSSIVPVDSGEKSETLTTKELTDFVEVGSNAAEFIKIMPGFSISNGTSNKANYTGEIIGINANGNGNPGSQSPLNGAYSYNGLPTNSLDILADGAHVSDPGCNCDTPVNPNGDMVSEFKVLASNYSAENQKGPIVISSVAKSGGNQFHGDAMFSARNHALNANDAYNNAVGASKPLQEFYYPEAQIGGPVLIPGTSFNKDRNKLFFFAAFEYYYQVLDTGVHAATVPTPSMLTGDFSTQSLQALGNITATGGPPGVPCAAPNQNLPCLNAAALAKYPGGMIPSSALDPNMVNLMKLYPAANANPNQTGGFNYIKDEIFNQNNDQFMTREDYSISDNTKLFVRYNRQHELQQFPIGLWWTQDVQVPYPTSILGKNSSQSVSVSLTHVFSPTMTNEFVFGYTKIAFPNVFQDPSKVDRSSVGYTYAGLFKNGIKQIPSFGGNGWENTESALVFNPGGFEDGGASQGLYADKWMPSLSDTVAKVWSTHTVKGGFFWEYIRNAQPANNDSNGYLQYYQGDGNIATTGDAYADGVLGILGAYTETSFNRVNDIAYNTYEGFAQDDWKVSKRLTVNYGLRFTHFQPWEDRLGDGYSIFNPSQFGPACAPAPTYCGFEWHKKDASVPVGGFPTRALFYQPRVGAAYDLTGTGKTVLRGGWGRYYFHSGQFTSGLDASAGVSTFTLGNSVALPNGTTEPLIASNIDTLPVTAVAASPAAVDSTDNRQPYTDSYSVTVSQRMPWSSLMEVSYVGNRTRDIASADENINLVPLGAMLASANGGKNPNTLATNAFRPLGCANPSLGVCPNPTAPGYGDLDINTNNLRSNYNALQVTWLRTRGRYTINLNYTYGKSMGIVNFNDQFNLNNDYGVQPNNRTHIFNAAYHIDLPSPAHERVAAGFVNGWEFSGITQVESGPNLWLGGGGTNFGMNLNSAIIPGSISTQNPSGIQISNTSLLGTPDVVLSPLITCNPRSGLGPHQYINPNCFAAPTQVGQNGPIITPPLYGPAYFNWDLAMFKSFRLTESKSLQFRFDGYNFMNHPLWSFNGNNLGLGFNPTTFAVNTPLFGTTTTKQGHRIIQMQAKFVF